MDTAGLLNLFLRQIWKNQNLQYILLAQKELNYLNFKICS